MLEMLGELDAWIDDTPPYGDKQRFGNLAFRDWGARLAKVGSYAHAHNARMSKTMNRERQIY
jgi:hypothetical protein